MLRLWTWKVELAAPPPQPAGGEVQLAKIPAVGLGYLKVVHLPPFKSGIRPSDHHPQPGDLDLTAVVSSSLWTGMLLLGIMLRSLLTEREIALPALGANTIRVSEYLLYTVQPLLGALLLLCFQV